MVHIVQRMDLSQSGLLIYAPAKHITWQRQFQFLTYELLPLDETLMLSLHFAFLRPTFYLLMNRKQERNYKIFPVWSDYSYCEGEGAQHIYLLGIGMKMFCKSMGHCSPNPSLDLQYMDGY